MGKHTQKIRQTQRTERRTDMKIKKSVEVPKLHTINSLIEEDDIKEKKKCRTKYGDNIV